MPRKSTLDLVWPVAGIDRSISYQKQPPYTTPDALNVRTEDMSEYRERGGSRPGLGLAIRTQLPGPVRLLTRIAVLRTDWPKNNIALYGNHLNDGLTPTPLEPSPTFNSSASFQGLGAYLNGVRWGIAIPPARYAQADSTKVYEISAELRPAESSQMTGTATMFVGLVDEAADPKVDGVECNLVFSGTSYSVGIIEWKGGVSFATALGGPYTDDVNQPGKFYVKITPGFFSTVEVFWRRQLVATLAASVMLGNKSAFKMVTDDNSIEVTKFKTDYYWDTTVNKTYRSQRRDIVVAVSEGDLYVEDATETLQLEVAGGLSPEAELKAVDREQLLYIADYGAAVSGDAAGVIATAGFNTLKDTTKNFTTLGIDSNFVIEMTNSDYTQNEKQIVALYNTDSGDYRLGFRGEFTSPIPQATQGSGVTLKLEGLSTIGTGNVLATGVGGGPITVEFKGTLAGTDLQLLAYQADGLEDLGGGVPSIEITTSQVGAGGDFVRGSYTINSVSGDTITFSPAIAVASGFIVDIGAVTYSVVRSPKVYNPKTGLLLSHSAAVGATPAGCRLVELYRDRIVYAASDLAPHVWYMSRQGDPYDWDYSQEDSGSAIFAQPSIGGQLADPITALIAHGDECLIVGCYNSLWIIRGDPGYGGTQDQLSRKVGIVGPDAWCRTPDDMAVFLSPDGLYVMPAGCSGFPTSLSRERLPDDLVALTPEREIIKLEYDTIHRGIHIFVTKHDGSTSAHWWFDWEAKSFWRVSLQNDHEPFSTHERIAWDDTPVVLVGGRDGYIRSFQRDMQSDDQDNTIESYCLIGPFHLDRLGFSEGVVTALTATLGSSSGPVDWELLVGDSSENATRSAPRESGTWFKQGLNYRARPRARGVSGVLKVKNGSSNMRWFLERVTAAVRSAGQRRVR